MTIALLYGKWSCMLILFTLFVAPCSPFLCWLEQWNSVRTDNVSSVKYITYSAAAGMFPFDSFHIMFVMKEVQDKLRALNTSQEIVVLRPCAFGWMTC